MAILTLEYFVIAVGLQFFGAFVALRLVNGKRGVRLSKRPTLPAIAPPLAHIPSPSSVPTEFLTGEWRTVDVAAAVGLYP